MNILIIGAGGREHVLAWKLSQSRSVNKIYCCPGNGGMKKDGYQCIAIDHYSRLAEFAVTHHIDLTVVGPEQPLCEGIADIFRSHNLNIFGPSGEAAQLEASKWFAKQFMKRHGIPHAAAERFDNAAAAIDFLHERGAPTVVKADGLAAGKGVTVAMTVEEADTAVRACFNGVFGDAGKSVLVEDYLDGVEASTLAFVDNHTIKALSSSQDHKRLRDNDSGPNTGGMGAYSPAPIVGDEIWRAVREEILRPFHEGCKKDDLDYRGIIYAGIMITENGPVVLEFNVRFGDPEAQVVLPRLDGDLAEIMLNTVHNELDKIRFSWSDQAAVCIVMASNGYPATYEKGFEIEGLDLARDCGALVFHAGTRLDGEQIVTDGGRVLGITALGDTIRDAAGNAYNAVEKVRWPGAYYRKDIAAKCSPE